jgi:hypothetical protein
MPEEQAKLETSHAIAYAAANHTKWFWGGGAQHRDVACSRSSPSPINI